MRYDMRKALQWIVTLLWTAVVIAGGFQLSNSVNQATVFAGYDLRINTADTLHYMLIESDQPVQYQAASNAFFLLRKLSGETIVAVPQTPPVGWIDDYYYKAGPVQIPSGKWLVVNGSPAAEITSLKQITVRVIPTDEEALANITIVVLLCLLVWAVGLIFLAIVHLYH